MRRYIANIISVMYTLPRLILHKIYTPNLKFSFIERISPNVVIETSRKAELIFGDKVRIHSGCKLKVRGKASLKIGDNVRINYGCIIVCHEHIEIQTGVEFGPNVLVYDHDHDFRNQEGIKAGMFKCSPVFIGENTWIGAGTVILRGTTIGKECVIGASSIVSGNIPDGSQLIQTRKSTIKQIFS